MMNNTAERSKSMTTLSSCINELVKEGYIDSFNIKDSLLHAPSNDQKYSATDVKIDNFYRFEGASDPEDSAVLYAISTKDGVLGMIVNAYGSYGNEEVNQFIRKVKNIKKQKPSDA